jgi:nitroreductase
MTLILCILLGLIAGQYIKLAVDPTLIDFFRRAWSSMVLKAPEVKEAIATLSMGPLQKRVKQTFKQLDSEAKAKEGVSDAKTKA